MNDSGGLMLLQVRVPRELVKRVDHIAIELGTGRAAAIVHLLTLGILNSPYRYVDLGAS